MTALELGSLILASEFALVAWGILFFLLRRQHKQIHSDHAHAGAVIEKLETTEISRRDALTTMFESTYRLEGEELEAKVDEYVAREKAFYHAMLSLYLERDGAKLKDIPAELTKILTPWASLTPNGMVHAGEIGNLESEKAELASELESTKQTLDELMSEYSAAFNRAQQKPKQAVAPSEHQPLESPQEIAEELDQDDFDFLSGEDETLDKIAIEDNIVVDTIKPSNLEDDLSEPSPPESDQQRPEPSTVNNLIDDLDDELAKEELEGLADLFDSPSAKR